MVSVSHYINSHIKPANPPHFIYVDAYLMMKTGRAKEKKYDNHYPALQCVKHISTYISFGNLTPNVAPTDVLTNGPS